MPANPVVQDEQEPGAVSVHYTQADLDSRLASCWQQEYASLTGQGPNPGPPPGDLHVVQPSTLTQPSSQPTPQIQVPDIPDIVIGNYAASTMHTSQKRASLTSFVAFVAASMPFWMMIPTVSAMDAAASAAGDVALSRQMGRIQLDQSQESRCKRNERGHRGNCAFARRVVASMDAEPRDKPDGGAVEGVGRLSHCGPAVLKVM